MTATRNNISTTTAPAPRRASTLGYTPKITSNAPSANSQLARCATLLPRCAAHTTQYATARINRHAPTTTTLKPMTDTNAAITSAAVVASSANPCKNNSNTSRSPRFGRQAINTAVTPTAVTQQSKRNAPPGQAIKIAAIDRISHPRFAAPRIIRLPRASAQTNNTPADIAAAAQATQAILLSLSNNIAGMKIPVIEGPMA
ncbi:MAG: hypothetical protein ISS76_00415 [Phycisphaerae bacterium]|nr:hypothetical protein [Phycisphaerae bacterium]